MNGWDKIATLTTSKIRYKCKLHEGKSMILSAGTSKDLNKIHPDETDEVCVEETIMTWYKRKI